MGSIGPLILLAALVGLMVPTGAAFMAFHAPDSNFVVGRLAMKGSEGRISWDSEPATDDPGGPPLPTGVEKQRRDQEFALSGHGYTVNGKPLAPMPVWTFTSEPLPRALELNVSRHLELDLYFNQCSGYSTQADPYILAELRIGDRLVAGAHPHSQSFFFQSGGSNLGGAPPPTVPAGFCLRPFRMMLTVPHLDAGAVLTLKLSTLLQNTDHQIGLADPHASVLRIPVFSPEEVIYRLPVQESGDDPDAEAPPGGSGLAALSLLAPALLALRARRAAPRLALLLLLPALAGCLGGSSGGPDGADASAPPSGSAKIDVIRGDSPGLANGTSGSILGIVRDDLGLPIERAHVTLTGSSHFTNTDQHGRFQLVGVKPGPYKVRIDQQGYNAFEQDVLVEANAVLRMEIRLDLSNPRESNDRPHRHDDWGGEMVKVLPELDIVGSMWRLPPPNLILPGARELAITVSWDMDWMTWAWLRFEAAHEGTSFHGVNNSVTHLFRSGETVRIPLTFEMTDGGHQRATIWGDFGVQSASYMDNGGAVGGNHLAAPTLDPASFHVKMVLEKGIVPFERRHPDFWAGNNTLRVLANAKPTRVATGLDLPTEPVLLFGGGNNSWISPKIVPPETSVLDIVLKAERTATVPFDWELWYKDAMRLTTDSHGGGNDAFRCAANAAGASGKASMVSKDAAKREWVFKLELKPGQADPFYARRSDWCFWAAPVDGNAYNVDYEANAEKPMPLTLTVTAIRAEG